MVIEYEQTPDPSSPTWLWLRGLAMDIMSCCCSKSLPYADVAVVWDIMFLAGRIRCTLGCVLAFLEAIQDDLMAARSLGDLMLSISSGVRVRDEIAVLVDLPM